MQNAFSNKLTVAGRDKQHTVAACKNTEIFNAKFLNGEFVFDFNGHFRNKKSNPTINFNALRNKNYYEEKIAQNLMMRLMTECDPDCIERTQKALDRKSTIKLNIYSGIKCWECEEALVFSFDGKTIKTIEKCKHPKGYPAYSVQIDVPSGVLVFANWFNVEEWEHMDHDGPHANHQEMKHYAKQGVVQAYCGNTNPGVYRNNGKFFIGVPGRDEKGQEIDPIEGEKICTIGTNLWAWSATDLERAKKLDGARVVSSGKEYYKIPVEPGRYKASQYVYKTGTDLNETKKIFGTIEAVK